MSLTQAEVHRLFMYDPHTGSLTWRTTVSSRAKAGHEAGRDHGHGYRRVNISCTPYLTHRVIWLWMTGDWPAGEIDHINQVKDDNRWCNLRVATRTENNRNIPLQRNNTSGHVGVYWNKCTRRWESHIGVNGGTLWLGRFDCKHEAILARVLAEIEHGYHPNHGK